MFLLYFLGKKFFCNVLNYVRTFGKKATHALHPNCNQPWLVVYVKENGFIQKALGQKVSNLLCDISAFTFSGKVIYEIFPVLKSVNHGKESFTLTQVCFKPTVLTSALNTLALSG